MIATLFFLGLLVAASAAPKDATRLLYDQRQEGEFNVHADLKNIVVLVIPTTSSTSSSPVGSLADFLVRALPMRKGNRKKAQQGVLGEETLHFIESKTAPYHVDISRSRNQLAKLHPEIPAVSAEEIVIAKSPAIALVKDENHSRTARAFVLTVPSGDEYSEVKDEEKKKKYGKKKTAEPAKSMLKVLGVEHDEDCGPGVYRDADGICRVIQK